MKSTCGIGIFALCFTMFAAEHVKVSPEEVLFLAHFNTKAGVETGNVDELINNAEVTSGNGGFPFKDSAPANEALNIVGKGRYFSIGSSWSNLSGGQQDIITVSFSIWFLTRRNAAAMRGME